MKRLLLLSALLLSFVIGTQAQEIEFEPFENALYGVQGLAPVGWESRGFGSYARAEAPTDLTAVFIQSAPMSADELLETVKAPLGIEEIPAVTGQIEGALLWDTRRVDVTIQGMDISLSIATSEQEDKTYIVMLQSLTEEHDALAEAVFVPVVEAVAPLVEAEGTAEATDEALPYAEEIIRFESGEFSLEGTLTTPEGEGPFPVVVLITGSGPNDRNESLAPLAEIEPFRDIADYLTRNGIAVFRYDERGVGESDGVYAEATLDDFAADASAAVDMLAERETFSAIGLVGHSEGGIIAPYVANNNENVDFVIGLAAPAVNMSEVLLQQNRRVYRSMGMEEADVEAIVAEVTVAFDALMAGDEETLRESVTRLIELQGGIVSEVLLETALSQFQGMATMGYFSWDIPATWSEVEQPILAIYGELDIQVDSFQNAPALEEATAANEDVTIVVFPNMNHILQEAETGGLEEYPTAAQEVMSDVLETMSEWIHERF